MCVCVFVNIFIYVLSIQLNFMVTRKKSISSLAASLTMKFTSFESCTIFTIFVEMEKILSINFEKIPNILRKNYVKIRIYCYLLFGKTLEFYLQNESVFH